MDKFDESIKQSEQKYQPNANFVDMTMKQIYSRQPKKRLGLRVWVPMAITSFAVLALLVLFLPFGSHSPQAPSPSGPSSTVQTKPSTNGVQSSTTGGTDDATLSGDLNSINSSMNQENSDQNSASTSLNDQSQVIAVPTD